MELMKRVLSNLKIEPTSLQAYITSRVGCNLITAVGIYMVREAAIRFKNRFALRTAP